MLPEWEWGGGVTRVAPAVSSHLGGRGGRKSGLNENNVTIIKKMVGGGGRGEG